MGPEGFQVRHFQQCPEVVGAILRPRGEQITESMLRKYRGPQRRLGEHDAEVLKAVLVRGLPADLKRRRAILLLPVVRNEPPPDGVRHASRIHDLGLDEDRDAGRHVRVPECVGELVLGACDKLPADNAPGQQKLERLGEAGFPLAVWAPHRRERGWELERLRLPTEGAEPLNLKLFDPQSRHIPASARSIGRITPSSVRPPGPQARP